jgi:hypothetical protein
MNPDAISEEEKVAVKEYKNDLFRDVLPALDSQDKKYYSTLTDAQKKDISIWLLTRYMSAAGSHYAGQLYTVNETVNKRSSFLTSNKTENSLTTGRHKELQWMLLAITGTGRRERHKLPATPRGIKKTPLVEVLISRYPLMKDDDIELLLELNTNEEMKSFLKDNGFDDKTIKELFKGEEKVKAK